MTLTQNLPEARRMSAFRSVWRRIYIHDECVLQFHTFRMAVDWISAGTPSDEPQMYLTIN
jgi:hypothetical protein